MICCTMPLELIHTPQILLLPVRNSTNIAIWTRFFQLFQFFANMLPNQWHKGLDKQLFYSLEYNNVKGSFWNRYRRLFPFLVHYEQINRIWSKWLNFKSFSFFIPKHIKSGCRLATNTIGKTNLANRERNGLLFQKVQQVLLERLKMVIGPKYVF